MMRPAPDPMFRPACGDDFAAVADLMNRYAAVNLTADQRGQGFLLATFTPAQIEAMHRALGVVVALVGDEVVGCLCGADLGSAALPPPAARMVALMPDWALDGVSFRSRQTFLYGPVCIDANFRGRGLLRGLFDALLLLAQPRFDSGIAFVARSNPHSLGVHRDGLGMEPVGEFEFAGEQLIALAFVVGR